MRLTIRTKLALLVLAVLLPLLAAAAFKFSSDLAEGRRLSHQNQLDMAQLVAGQLDEVLSGQIESLLALASFRTLDRIQDADLEYDPADYPAAFDRLLATLDYTGWRARQAERLPYKRCHSRPDLLQNSLHGFARV